MRIDVVGGGPAGLYFGILMKMAFPAVAITIRERNRPDDTFGFGVVFSDETLSFLDEADPESAAEIRARFRWWSDIQTFFRGTWTSSTGHGFAAIARTALLAILQRRATGLGCELRCEEEVVDPEPLLARADVVIACDGVNSLVRDRYAASFRPRVELGECRFCWLGTTRPLDAFTFLFVETRRTGSSRCTPTPSTRGMATWIVECREAAWRAAGLDAASEEDAGAHLRGDLRSPLDGHRLLANRSLWRTFPTVVCESWHHATWCCSATRRTPRTSRSARAPSWRWRTPSPSVAAFRAHGLGDVPKVLAAYEEGRRLDVAKLQRAAQTSRRWFENSRHRYRAQHPLAFTFNLMSRSKRITYDNLRQRDPPSSPRSTVGRGETVGNGAASDVAADGGPRVFPFNERFSPFDSSASALPPIFTPCTVRSLRLANRVVVSPMCQYSAVDGTPNDWHLVHLGSRAVGGAGLVIAEMTDVSADGRITLGCTGMYAREHVAAWKRIVDFVHAHSRTPIGLQLAHAGRKGSMKHDWSMADEPLTAAEGAWETLAPSAVPYRPGWPAPRAMTRADMERVRDEFVRAARWADEAGFDWLELHCAHGYLLSSFLSPLANFREDDFGGSLANRMRYPARSLRGDARRLAGRRSRCRCASRPPTGSRRRGRARPPTRRSSSPAS
jgi:anthraniloyl-CoA monooxygenase